VLSPRAVQLGVVAVVAAMLLAGQGGLLQYGFPVAALVAAVLIERLSFTSYLSFIVWLWMLTPFVRRVADLQSGWHEPSLILLAPYAASAWPPARELMAAVVRSIRVRPRFDGLGLFVAAALGAGIAIPFGLLTNPKGAIVETLNWWVPIAFGAYVAVRTADPQAVERALARTLMQCALVVGIYGLYQFQFAPVWDTEWMRNTEVTTFGRTREFEVRVFSTTHAPGVLGFLILPPILIWMTKPRLRDGLAMFCAALALALSQVRAAWIALAVATVLVQLRNNRRERIAFVAFLLVAGVAAAPFVLPIQVSDVTTSRFMTLFDPSSDISALSRFQGHIEMFDVIREHPFGIGMGVEDPTLMQLLGSRDSIVVTAFMQFGIIGATLYLLATIALAARLWIYYRNADTTEGLALAAVGIGLLSVGLLGTQTAGPIGVIVWLTAGLGTVRVRSRRLSRRETAIALPSSRVVALRPAAVE